MTREEAKITLEGWQGGHSYTDEQLSDAIDMAIKALEQEPCEDAISRRAAIEIARSNIHYELNKEYEYARELLEKTMAEINSLPPVTPQTKTDVLDKIRAEIDKIYEREGNSFDCLNALDDLKCFIDKYKAESEGTE